MYSPPWYDVPEKNVLNFHFNRVYDKQFINTNKLNNAQKNMIKNMLGLKFMIDDLPNKKTLSSNDDFFFEFSTNSSMNFIVTTKDKKTNKRVTYYCDKIHGLSELLIFKFI